MSLYSNHQKSIYDLHIRPTYAVLVKQREKQNVARTSRQILNDENLKLNQEKEGLSKKAARRLTNSINWLVASATVKRVYHKKTDQNFKFRINFVTLTIPVLEHDITDHQFKNELLRNFINAARYKFGLENYVWKVETQENGNIHAHFTTDCFMHWQELRDCWNKILASRGILQAYTAKHSQMTFQDYCEEYNSDGSLDSNIMHQRFNYGTKTNWASPNSTDVHAVYKVKDVAAYLCKYMSKSEEDRRKIKGRLWACSQSLSATNKCILSMYGGVDSDVMQAISHPQIEYKPILSHNTLTGQAFHMGEIFFFKAHYWGKFIRGRLLDHYNNHRMKIRHSIPDLLTPVSGRVSYSLNTPNFY